MALSTVAAVVADVRTLLQDTVEPYRYSDDDLVLYLNLALATAKRVRPDLFISYSITTDLTISDNFTFTDVYRPSFLYYIAGRATLRDDEDTADARSSALINKFVDELRNPK